MIEILAVVGITGVLAVVLVGVATQAMDSGAKVREINAARQLVLALQATAAENDGVYMAGMDYRAGTGTYPVYKADGSQVTGHAAHRYPFRLGPYLGDEFDGTIYVNRNKSEILNKGPHMADYHTSTFPALGMNIYCVGGVVRFDGTMVNPGDCIGRAGNFRGSVIAFASGGSGTGKAKMSGFNFVSPPTKTSDSPYCVAWDDPSSWNANKDPMNFGWVDFRYDGKAVCAFLDGSVRLMGVKELSDMRNWTPAAQDSDDPDYALAP